MLEVRIKRKLPGFSLDVSFSVAREIFSILGPSGSGKTMTLQCIAGLVRPDEGYIKLDGTVLFDSATGVNLPPHRREVGFVFQNYALFPHLTVDRNIAYGISHKPRQEEREIVAGLLDKMGIERLGKRYPWQLSAGQQQRVALARALAVSPRILLMDEPLSNLDLQTSKYLRLELRRIQQELGITTIHVTHNQVEAEEMADRIAIFNAGKLEQVGKPQEVFFSPGNEAVSNFIGALNILDCDSSRVLGPGLTEVDCKGTRVILPHDGNSVRKIAFLPSDVYVSNVIPPGPSVNRFTGVITGVEPLGALVRLQVKTGEHVLKAEVSRDLFEDMALSVGKEVYLKLKLRRMRVLEE